MAEARAHLLEGLERNERLAYVREGDPGGLRQDLDGLPGLDEHLDRGRIQLLPFDSLQGAKPPMHPAAELPLLAAMAADALDAGYRGLRIFANGPSGCETPPGEPSTCATSI